MPEESKTNSLVKSLYYGAIVVCLTVVIIFTLTALTGNAGNNPQEANQSTSPHAAHQGEPQVQKASVNIGDVMPDFTLVNVNAKPGEPREWKLSDNDGKHTLLFVADTKCSCVSAYTERVQSFFSKYQDKGVRMAFLYPQPNETEDVIRQSMNQRGYNWPGLKDDGQQILQQLNIKCTTEAYLFDPENRLVYRGAFDDNTFKPEEVKERLLVTALESSMANKPILKEETPVKACIITRLDDQSQI